MIALNANVPKGELWAHAFKRRLISSMYSLPAFFQKTT